MCCRQQRPGDLGFMRGCLIPSVCRVEDDAGHVARTPEELAALVAPITTESQALGLVALAYGEVLQPSAASQASFLGWQGIPNAPPAYAVTRDATGFVVHAPAMAACGCSHHVLRVAFHVSRGGCVERLSDAPEPLAHAANAVCVD
jgi:hypothetical protein